MKTTLIPMVFLPLLGSIVGRTLARVLDVQGDSLLGISMQGTFELTGLLLGLFVAGVFWFRSERVA